MNYKSVRKIFYYISNWLILQNLMRLLNPCLQFFPNNRYKFNSYMKKLIFSLIFFLSTIVLVKGQQVISAEEMVIKNVDALVVKLSLTSDQKIELTNILLKQAQSMDSLRTSLSEDIDRKALRIKMTAIMETNESQVNLLLTTYQRKAYILWKKELELN